MPLLADVQNLGWFVVAGILLNLTPGPDMFYILSHALRRQPGAARAGALAAWGVISGCLVHVILAAVGLGALIVASATAYEVLKWVGALYLVYLGVKNWRVAARSVGAPVAIAPVAGRQVFIHGLLTNLLNPKVVLFFFGLFAPVHCR